MPVLNLLLTYKPIRLSDNWKGEIVPIAYDAIFNDTKSQLIINENIIYDNAPHLLTDTLLKSSEFNLKKF